jgi:Flp pilus assembly protein TadB
MKTWLQLIVAIAQIVVAWLASQRRAEDRAAGQAEQITAAEKDEARAKNKRLAVRAERAAAERLQQAEQPVGSVQPGSGDGPGAAG